MTEFIERMGRAYFSSRWQNSYFLYEGVVHRFRALTDDVVQCIRMDNKEAASVPMSHFTGFDVVKYPELGYRYLPRNGLGFSIKRSITYEPGLRSGNVTTIMTPFSQMVTSHSREERPSEDEAVDVAFNPRYHTKDALEALFSSEIPAYVPGPSVLIEPCCSTEDEEFTVFLRGQVAGFVTDGVAKATNARNRKFIEEVISR